MAKIEKVTVYCDGPCGGNEVAPDNEMNFTIRHGNAANRQVDLCPDCAGALMEIYNKGTVRTGGRPRSKAAETGVPDPTVIPPATTAATISPETPVTSSPVVVDAFDEPVSAPLGTGV